MGRYLKKLYTQLKSTYPEFEADFNEEYTRQCLAFELIEARLASECLQNEFAKLTGIPQPNISKFENGEGNPTLSTLIKIARNCGCTIEVKLKKQMKDRSQLI